MIKTLLQRIRVVLHWLGTFFNGKQFKEDHRVCSETTYLKIVDHVFRNGTVYYCSCGYEESKEYSDE